MREQIRANVLGASQGQSPVKFVLISGHDTTLIPFMAAVAPRAWDRTWPAYASMATIELLRVGGQNASIAGDYFRFVYNGEVVRLDGCKQGAATCDGHV